MSSRCGGRSSSIPKNRSPRRRVPHAGGRGDRGDRGVDAAGAAARRSLVLSRRRVRRARAVAGPARKSGSRPRATASASRTRSNRRSRSIPRCRMPTSASACITTTPTSRPRRPGCCAGCCCCPGGDRVEGMQEMLRARSERSAAAERGRLPAAPDLPVVREAAAARAELLRGLRDRHPQKPAFPAAHRRDRGRLPARSAGEPAVLAGAARRGAGAPRRRAGDGGGGRAARASRCELDRLSETEAADPHLRAVIDMKPTAPFGVVARAQLQLGQALDRLGRRDEALAAYRAALAQPARRRSREDRSARASRTPRAARALEDVRGTRASAIDRSSRASADRRIAAIVALS